MYLEKEGNAMVIPLSCVAHDKDDNVGVDGPFTRLYIPGSRKHV